MEKRIGHWHAWTVPTRQQKLQGTQEQGKWEGMPLQYSTGKITCSVSAEFKKRTSFSATNLLIDSCNLYRQFINKEYVCVGFCVITSIFVSLISSILLISFHSKASGSPNEGQGLSTAARDSSATDSPSSRQPRNGAIKTMPCPRKSPTAWYLQQLLLRCGLSYFVGPLLHASISWNLQSVSSHESRWFLPRRWKLLWANRKKKGSENENGSLPSVAKVYVL